MKEKLSQLWEKGVVKGAVMEIQKHRSENFDTRWPFLLSFWMNFVKDSTIMEWGVSRSCNLNQKTLQMQEKSKISFILQQFWFSIWRLSWDSIETQPQFCKFAQNFQIKLY